MYEVGGIQNLPAKVDHDGTELFEFSCYTGEILKIVKTGSKRKIVLIL
jgi:hypothetical protein